MADENLRRAARGVAVVAAAFSAVVAVLLLATVLQMRRADPLHSPALEKFMAAQRSDPAEEELKEQVRALHLLARKAYFAGQWQLRTGGVLLFGGVVVLLVALRLAVPLRSAKPVRPDPAPAVRAWRAAAHARTALAAAAGGLLVAALVVAAASRSPLRGDPSPARQAVDVDPLQVWPAFRGPGGLGVAAVTSAPLDWDGDSGRGIAWKVEVPLPGYSSPVVWGDRVFLTGADESLREVYCFDAATGELQWRHPVTDVPGGSSEVPRTHVDTGYAPSTVATDGRVVAAVFPNGDLLALDLDGRRLWAQSLGLPDNHYGHSSSLLLDRGLLFVQWDQSSGGRLLALAAASGETVWRAARDAISWASPIVAELNGGVQLVVANSAGVDGYDPASGAHLWGERCLRGELGPSPAVANGMVFVANDRAVAAGIRVGPAGSEVVWRYDGELPDTASPVATADVVVLATSYGVVVCLSAATGEPLWEAELDHGFYASPVVVGDHLYLLDLAGVMHVFELGPERRQVASMELGETAAATPAFVDGRLFVRGENHLYSITGV